MSSAKWQPFCLDLNVLTNPRWVTTPYHAYLNPFYLFVTWNTKYLRKWENKTWTEAAIPCINLTSNQYNALVAVIDHVTNDAIIPVNSITSQMNAIAPHRAHVNGAEIVLKSKGDARALHWYQE